MSSDDTTQDRPEAIHKEAAHTDESASVSSDRSPADVAPGENQQTVDVGSVEAVNSNDSAIDHVDAATGEVGEDTVTEGLTQLRSQLEKLSKAFDEKIRFDAGREALIDRLHAELQEYKADLAFRILRPLFLDLINLHNEVGKLVSARQPVTTSAEANELLQVYATFQDDIEAILGRYGVDCFTTSESQFDAKRQRALVTVPTADPQQNHTIAERIRPGFSYEGRILRPEEVAVFTHASPKSP